jgi:uncharacterized membrane protein YozB (DUF420 family)
MNAYGLLPHLNALLNGASALLVLTGYYFIRRNRIRLHRALMISATALSSLFLVSYLSYHAEVGTVRLQKQGWIRPVYFGILSSHTFLAALTLPLVILTLRYAFAGKFARHRATARWTVPVWIYVSITGVLVYLILYR